MSIYNNTKEEDSNIDGFTILLKDGSSLKNCDWGSISTQKRVKYQDGFKTIFSCNLNVLKIKIELGELETEIEVPDDYEVYQAIRGQTTFLNGESDKQILGRVVGLVKDGEVVEERFLNLPENIISGWRK